MSNNQQTPRQATMDATRAPQPRTATMAATRAPQPRATMAPTPRGPVPNDVRIHHQPFIKREPKEEPPQ